MNKLSLLIPAFATLVAAGCASGEAPSSSASPLPPRPTQDAATTEPHAEAVPTYSEVHAILTRSCAGCHGAVQPKEDLDLTSYATLMKGGEHGPVVVPGNPAASRIVKALRGEGMDRMPYKLGPLPEDEIATIAAWIQAGAKGE